MFIYFGTNLLEVHAHDGIVDVQLGLPKFVIVGLIYHTTHNIFHHRLLHTHKYSYYLSMCVLGTVRGWCITINN